MRRTGGPGGATSAPTAGSNGSTGSQVVSSKPRLVPSVEFEPSVVGLALVEVGGEEWAGRRAPLVVGGDHVGGAVVVGDLELRQQAEPLAVDVAQHVPLEEPAPPPVGDDRAEHVVAGGDQRGDVVGVVAEAVGVTRPAGRQDVVADDVPVEMDAVHPGGGHVQPGLLDTPILQVERAPQVGRRRRPVEWIDRRWRDPRRRPVLRVEQAGFDRERLTPERLVSIVTPNTHTHGSALSRDELVRRPVHEDGGVTVDATGRNAVDLDLVRRLAPRANVGVGDPRQARRTYADADFVGTAVLCLQLDDLIRTSLGSRLGSRRVDLRAPLTLMVA